MYVQRAHVPEICLSLYNMYNAHCILYVHTCPGGEIVLIYCGGSKKQNLCSESMVNWEFRDNSCEYPNTC